MTSPSPAPGLELLVEEVLRTARERFPHPGSTYRLQFHSGFTLRDAARLLPYLESLGVTHLYSSPLLKARPGSVHGYDILDHGELNPEIGTEAELAALMADCRARKMGQIMDAVPNHMCVVGENAWWMDVLEHGPSSPYAEYFDIAWSDSPRPGMDGRLLLPVLGDQYGAVLESGQLVPVLDENGFSVRYYNTRLPLDPRTYPLILAPAAEELRTQRSAEDPDAVQLSSILHAARHLPTRSETDPQRIFEARVECTSIRRRLQELPERFPAAYEAVQASLKRIAGTPRSPESFTALDELLEAQAYRPCFWRVASDEINYRRFFDVNDLAALTTEREDVFRAIHKTWLRWLTQGYTDGLRIDHPDGLFDPQQYLERLQESYLFCLAKAAYEANPGRFEGLEWDSDEDAIRARLREVRGEELYVVVEKILGDNEQLPPNWVCAGTTGYEFINVLNGLFIDSAGEGPLSALYEQFTGQDDPWPEIVNQKKRQVMQSSLSSELNALAYQLDRIARFDRRSRDFTLNGLRKALREVIACFPVYRSYVNGGVHDTDKAVVGKATRWAYRRVPMLGKAIFDFIRDTILLKDSPSGPSSEQYRLLQKRFVGKFQQVTAPVTAKGVEDTAFYVYDRLLSLNEVGGEPGHFGRPPEQVHQFLTARAAMPGSLSPLSTHDTKRSEDVRARLNVLSELAGEWAERVKRWAALNGSQKVVVDEGVLAPDSNEEYLLYQTLVGAFPDESLPKPGEPAAVPALSEEFRSRIQQYAHKALAEAKVHTSWINPDSEYEAAVAQFIDHILDPGVSSQFLKDLAAFASRVAFHGRINSLAQTLIRCTAPGIPDTYQGTEVWELSLVDPDNRRPVDYGIRERWLREVDEEAASSRRGRCRLALRLSRDLADPRAKLFLIATALRCRRDHPAIFERGSYLPLRSAGDKAGHVFAFLRAALDMPPDDPAVRQAIVVVPRLSVGLVPDADRASIGRSVWGDTVIALPEGLAQGYWYNVLTGETVPSRNGQLVVAEALGVFPVAVLLRSEEPSPSAQPLMAGAEVPDR
jgi:(1->4)-alpha-D-glucan 1-alpha-D-glucosylmutase